MQWWINMKIADANIILRYLLNDNEELSERAADILENNEIFIPNEVIAEVIYVLKGVYKIESNEISDTLIELFKYENLQFSNLEVLIKALNLFGKGKIDFVDALLYAYNRVNGHEVYTFDKKLNKLLKHN